MRNAFARMFSWNSWTLFWKIYTVSTLFVLLVVAAGEWSEDWIGYLLYGAEGLGIVEETLLWVICSMSVTATACLFMTRFLMKSIRSFTHTISALEKGDLTVRMPEDMALRGDEIGELARTFNIMIAQREQEVQREKNLLAAISHELRSPLTRMMVSVELLRKERQEASPQLERLLLEAERMDKLIGYLIEYSKYFLKKQEIHSVDVHEALELLCEDARFEGQQKRCSVELRCSRGLFISAAEEELWHAVENVMRNALKYSPAGGKIRVLAEQVHSICRIRVEDQGPGVPEEYLFELFRPFFRIDSSRQRNTGGTGMGLSIAKQIVHSLNGNIWAENIPEGGLAVVMEFPASGA